jgi:CheY-like chemotaxis protein
LSLRGRRVLIVEDEVVLAADLWQLFDMEGCHVLGPAATVGEALRLLASGPRPDGAVLGIDLHGVRSVQVAEALFALGVPFVVTTAYLHPTEPVFADAPVFSKPWHTLQLRDALVRLLSGPEEGTRCDGARVLVVEDEFLVALDLEIILRGFGYQVLGPEPSIVGALELIGQEKPDAVLLDLNLMDGLSVPVAEVLTAMSVPFLLLTAYHHPPDHPALKAAPLLGKPFRAEALRIELGRLLGARA